MFMISIRWKCTLWMLFWCPVIHRPSLAESCPLFLQLKFSWGIKHGEIESVTVLTDRNYFSYCNFKVWLYYHSVLVVGTGNSKWESVPVFAACNSVEYRCASGLPCVSAGRWIRTVARSTGELFVHVSWPSSFVPQHATSVRWVILL